ncbi:putative alcohol acetyltransferase FCK4 [Colletotrichum trifolii]|uniref:Putative alcohol acetyltransferase FCK4 n=1 Tax=Colletotrichum trifolii TaxID=5466 RepID=A0A4R8RUT9_COLTR|nr:putative alcohol acetyltransferase FCK4 [Colletotrichum trifolii]
MATQTSVVTAKEVQEDVGTGHYTIVRKATHVDRMFYLYHRLGIQSNVVVAARYAATHNDGPRRSLSDETVFSAMNAVISKYPELGLVGAVEPGEGSSHTLAVASLHSIDLRTCLEFVDNNVGEVDAQYLEKLHDQWPWADGEVKPGQPWWKVFVVGRRDVVFMFHHLVCDGSFGMTFHREFLAALNDKSTLQAEKQRSTTVPLDCQRVLLSDELTEAVHRKPPMLGVLYTLFRFLFFRLFYSNFLFFNDFPKPKPLPKDAFEVPSSADRAATKVTNYRIPADRTDAIISACREHGTTFTPFLTVMIAGTLAADYYPKAKVGFTRYAVDMRQVGNLEDLSAGRGKMINLAASAPEPEWLNKYRRAFPTPSSTEEKVSPKVDREALWDLVKDYGKRMKDNRSGGQDSALYKSWLSGNTVGPTLEEFMEKTLPSLGVFMHNTFSVSNVGALRPAATATGHEAYKIEDVQFSTGSPHGGAGYHGIVFNVAGTSGGDTVINACTEAGMAPENMPRGVLDGVMARIDTLLQRG